MILYLIIILVYEDGEVETRLDNIFYSEEQIMIEYDLSVENRTPG